MFEAIIFDFDGLILDTETLEFEAHQRFHARHGRELQLAEWQVGIGTWGAFDPWAAFNFTPEELQMHKEALHQEILSSIEGADLREGVRDLLEEARTSGIRLAIATSSDWDWIHRWTSKHEIQPYFEAFATRYEVPDFKPAPDLYLLALQKLGLQASQAIAVEDSLNGSRAALAAGLRCVVVPNRVTAALPFDPACHRLDTLQGGLAQLRALFAE